MSFVRRTCALLSAATLAATTVVLSPTSGTSHVASGQAPSQIRSHHAGTTDAAQVLLDWERISFRTVYTDGATPVPVGVPVLGFTSLAMYDAIRSSERRHHSSETAAVAAAAHDVLLHYYPAAAAKLDADRTATLAKVPDGRTEDAGVAAGEDAAAEMLASRVGDNYLSTRFHYAKPTTPGFWQPTAPNTDMLAPWLGSLRPLVLKQRVRVGGPDPLTSDAYAADFNEVKLYGGATSTRRSADETATAIFYNSNSATMVADALIRHLEAAPIGLNRTARLFAVIHGAMTDSAITCWRLKRDVGFWRPSRAIARAGEDGNPATTTEAGWTPMIVSATAPEPNYSDYVSGHACLTSSAIEPIRRTLGEGTALELISANSPTHRFYSALSDIETDAFNARIWSGLHFRKAMTDGYSIGHRTARRVLRDLH